MHIKIIQAVSYTCNCRCDYCMNHGIKNNSKEVLVKDLIHFYNWLFNNSQCDSIDFTITGGEPFHPNVIQKTTGLLEFLYSVPTIQKVRINTNGYYVLPEICKNSKTLIQFSLDGKRDYCDAISHKKGLFDKVLENMAYCRKNNILYQTRTVVTDENLKDIDFVAELAEKYRHIAYIQTAKPVGGSKEKAVQDEYFKCFIRTESMKKRYRKLHNVKIVDLVLNCGYFSSEPPDTIALLVNPYGQIGACAFLATEFMSPYNIYNFHSIGLNEYKKLLVKMLGNKTCSFPNGFDKFLNNLSNDQKKQLKLVGVNGI